MSKKIVLSEYDWYAIAREYYSRTLGSKFGGLITPRHKPKSTKRKTT